MSLTKKAAASERDWYWGQVKFHLRDARRLAENRPRWCFDCGAWSPWDYRRKTMCDHRNKMVDDALARCVANLLSAMRPRWSAFAVNKSVGFKTPDIVLLFLQDDMGRVATGAANGGVRLLASRREEIVDEAICFANDIVASPRDRALVMPYPPTVTVSHTTRVFHTDSGWVLVDELDVLRRWAVANIAQMSAG